MKKLSYILIFFLTSCSFIPHYSRPALTLPKEWQQKLLTHNVKLIAVTKHWWQTFHSPELNRLMQIGLQQNTDLNAALQRIEEARANSTIASAPLWPSLALTGGVTKTKTIQANTDNSFITQNKAQLTVAYEVDLWGANRAAALSSQELFYASVFDHAALTLITSADIAQTYFSLLSTREQIRIANRNLYNANKVLSIVDAQYHEGALSALEFAQQKSAVAIQKAALAALEKSAINLSNKLAVLVGKTPESLHITGENFKRLRIPYIALMQPSSLLERRPDVARAEAQLLAANANIGVARAAFFPQLNLTNVGAIASNPIVKTITLGAATSLPIFQGGALQAQLNLTAATKRELVQLYIKSILVSLQEVEDALAAVKISAIRQRELAKAAAQARIAYDLTRQRFLDGAIDFQTLIITQNSLLQTENSYAIALSDNLNAHVLLFKALGGGWKI